MNKNMSKRMLRIQFILFLVLWLFAAEVGAANTANANQKQKTKNKRTIVSPSIETFSPSIPAEPVPEVAPSMTDRHIFLAVLFSSANQINYKGNLDLYGSSTPFEATEKTRGVFGLAAGYVLRRSSSFGYGGELVYELPRPSDGINGTAGGLIVHGTYEGSPSKSLLTASGNINFSFGSRAYVFAGLNYPFAFTGGDGQSFSGLPGYQLGGGFSITERISAEVSYRVLRLKGAIETPPLNLHIDEATFSGLVIAVHYLF
jgi:hypothetical protein